MSAPGPEPSPTPVRQPRRFGCLQVALLLLVAVLITAAATVWVARTYLYPAPIEPVVLSVEERQVLEEKLERVQQAAPAPRPGPRPPLVDRDARGEVLVDPEARGEPLVPELYREDPATRVLYFTQRELNALVAGQPDLAERVALHLSDDLVSATVLVTLPPDFPFMAGRTVRVDAGLGVRHVQGRPEVTLRGVSIMGVPLPEAWLGGLKGRDLVTLYGGEPGFWQAFADGVADLRVEQGRLRVELAP
jgi:hypothetical protein